MSSTYRVCVPVMMGGTSFRLWISSVACSQLGLLIGNGVLAGLGMVLDFDCSQMEMKALKLHGVPLGERRARHLRLPLMTGARRPMGTTCRRIGAGGTAEVFEVGSAVVGPHEV